ncbi:hypothetical protein ACHHYP_12345 [Achlya hypogyna]|uniref:Centrosomal protein of 70 kDa n=1 Tax=Achlya hypogyna TaxID=1202772 RepID=A0A1V9ZHE8_ACHHY|nr:hypothetical protein ACHHYP_12345 [Achlya hypogyna]
MSRASSDDGFMSDVDLQLSSGSVDRFLLENGLELSLATPHGSSTHGNSDDDNMSLERAGDPPGEPLSLEDFAPSAFVTPPPRLREENAADDQCSALSSLDFESLALASHSSMFESKSADEPSPRRPPYSALPRLATDAPRRPSSLSSRSMSRDVPVRRVLSMATTSTRSAASHAPEDGLRSVSWSGLPASASTTGSERMRRDELDGPVASPATLSPARTATPPLRTSPVHQSPTPPAVDAEWAPLNTLLLQHGLPRVHLAPVVADTVAPDAASLCSVVHEIIIQDLVLDATRNTKEQVKSETNLELLEKKIAELTAALASASQDTKQLQRERDELKAKAEQDGRAWKAARTKLEQQVRVSEHRVKAKELLIDRMQLKLQQQLDKDELAKSRDRSVFQKLQQRQPRKTSAADLKHLEIIRVFETERAAMADEIAGLQRQVHELCADLRAKENASPAAGAAPESALRDRFEAARREQERAAAALREREARIQDKMGAIEAELGRAQASVRELQEENANLHLEVQARPTILAYKQMQRRAATLERELAAQQLAVDEATDLAALRKRTGTAALVQRDRLNATLGLNRLNALPRETAIEVVKETCRELGLSDAMLITLSVRKLCAVVAAVPRLEAFVKDVSACVGEPLERVVPRLQAMRQELAEMAQLQAFRRDVLARLAQRCRVLSAAGDNQAQDGGGVDLRRALATVDELVEFETHFLQEKEMYAHALQNVESRPDVLVNKMVQHFRHLFGVKSMEGVFPKINEVYLFVNKMNAALEELKAVLGLPPTTSVAATLDALKQSAPTVPRPQKLEPDNYVVDRRAPDIAGLQQVRRHCLIIKELREELGATTDDEIVPRTKRLMELLSLSIHTQRP